MEIWTEKQTESSINSLTESETGSPKGASIKHTNERSTDFQTKLKIKSSHMQL